jgi:hypothetical protein
MHPAIINVTPEENYILYIEFDNGEYGWLDMKPFLGYGVFQRIKNQNVFQQVRIKFDTIEWDCGVDLDPEYVYEKCMKSEPA